MRALFILSKLVGGTICFASLVLFMGTIGAFEIGTIGLVYMLKHIVLYSIPLVAGFFLFTVACTEEENYVF